MVNFGPLTARLMLAMTQVCHGQSNKAPLHTCPQPHQMPITCHEKPTGSVAQAFSQHHTQMQTHATQRLSFITVSPSAKKSCSVTVNTNESLSQFGLALITFLQQLNQQVSQHPTSL